MDEVFDVFNLRWDEITAVPDVERMPVGETQRLRAIVIQRAAQRAELAGIPLVDLRQVFERAHDGDALVVGDRAARRRSG